MSYFIQDILIENFKSVQHCEIKDCNRINVFIGKPNAGKSNILEALSLFSVSFLKDNTGKKLTGLVRLEHETELFYNGAYKHAALIKTNNSSLTVNYNAKKGLWLEYMIYLQKIIYQVDEKLNVKGGYLNQAIKRYTFNPAVAGKRSHARYLIPPYGFNLFPIIEMYEDIKQDVIALFKEHNLAIIFDKDSAAIKIIQSKKEDEAFILPYHSIAHTLQRLIFFKAAIASNINSVLLFEEPEALSFPPYMAEFARAIINKKDNQFFIATHSPYVVNELLENARWELSIYRVDSQNNQTVVKQLSNDDCHSMFQSGADLFTHSKSFF